MTEKIWIVEHVRHGNPAPEGARSVSLAGTHHDRYGYLAVRDADPTAPARPKRRTVIGLIGLAGAGKSTVAEYLADTHGFQRHRFAGPLKAMLAVLGLSDREIEGDLKEQPCELLGGRTPRHAMVTLGTEWGRDMIDRDLWVRAWRRHAEQRTRVVAEDCRFPNEAEAIRAMGGVVWRIVRPGQTAGVHPSEAGQSAVRPDVTIPNDGSLDDLHRRVDDVIVGMQNAD